jgi:hypothetical protein
MIEYTLNFREGVSQEDQDRIYKELKKLDYIESARALTDPTIRNPVGKVKLTQDSPSFCDSIELDYINHIKSVEPVRDRALSD